MDKQKQIEEILEKVGVQYGMDVGGISYIVNAYKLASYLQPKIPKNSVILTFEEYEALVNQYKNLETKYSNLCDKYKLCKDANEILKQNVIIKRKDTAKKYHDAIKKMFDDADCFGWIEESETKHWHKENDKIAREEFGVEVE